MAQIAYVVIIVIPMIVHCVLQHHATQKSLSACQHTESIPELENKGLLLPDPKPRPPLLPSHLLASSAAACTAAVADTLRTVAEGSPLGSNTAADSRLAGHTHHHTAEAAAADGISQGVCPEILSRRQTSPALAVEALAGRSRLARHGRADRRQADCHLHSSCQRRHGSLCLLRARLLPLGVCGRDARLPRLCWGGLLRWRLHHRGYSRTGRSFLHQDSVHLRRRRSQEACQVVQCGRR